MRLVDIGLVGAFAAMVVAGVVAVIYWIRTLRHRTPGVTWGAAVVGTGELTEHGREFRRHAIRFTLLALVLFFVSSLLGGLAICCMPPPMD